MIDKQAFDFVMSIFERWNDGFYPIQECIPIYLGYEPTERVKAGEVIHTGVSSSVEAQKMFVAGWSGSAKHTDSLPLDIQHAFAQLNAQKNIENAI